jgi:hypothetical protein
MEPRHRRDQAEAQSAAGDRPAWLKAHKPLENALAIIFGDAGAAI